MTLPRRNPCAALAKKHGGFGIERFSGGFILAPAHR